LLASPGLGWRCRNPQYFIALYIVSLAQDFKQQKLLRFKKIPAISNIYMDVDGVRSKEKSLQIGCVQGSMLELQWE